MDGKIIAAIIIIVVLILCFTYSKSGTVNTPIVISAPNTSSTSHFTSGPNNGLVCGSPAAISAAKNYYDNVGEYHGVFVMDPISSYQVDATNCDVKYKYIPTPTSPRNDSEIDARRFTYAYTSEGWKPVLMLDWKSGVLNMGGNPSRG